MHKSVTAASLCKQLGAMEAQLVHSDRNYYSGQRHATVFADHCRRRY